MVLACGGDNPCNEPCMTLVVLSKCKSEVKFAQLGKNHLFVTILLRKLTRLGISCHHAGAVQVMGLDDVLPCLR